MAIVLQQGFTAGGELVHALPEQYRPSLRLPSDLQHEDERWMREALREAMRYNGRASPNPTVGCVIVKNNKIIARGATRTYGDWHAERVAIESLSDKTVLAGATAYVTLEPCGVVGKQPPCAPLLTENGITRCVIGAKDPHTKAGGLGVKHLIQNGVIVRHGVLAAECAAWHLPFLLSFLERRPVWIGKWAQTFDGCIADAQGVSQWLSSEASRAYTHFLRQHYDAILVGAGTVIADHPRLNARDVPSPELRQPIKIIFDPEGMIPATDKSVWEKILNQTFSAQCIYIVKDSSWKNISDSAQHQIKARCEILMCHQEDIWSDVQQQLAVRAWFGKSLQSIFVEGGSRVLSELLHREILDVLHIFVAPGWLGAHSMRATGADGQQRLRPEMSFWKLLAQESISNDTLIEYVAAGPWQRLASQLGL